MRSSLKTLFEPQNTIPVRPHHLKDRGSFLRELSIGAGARRTQSGSLAIVTQTQSRRAQNTQIVRGDPYAFIRDEMLSIQEYTARHQMFDLTRVIAPGTDEWRTHCRLLVSAEFPHLPLYWGNTLSDDHLRTDFSNPDFLTVSIPQWPEQKILVLPDHDLTFLLGSDYVGEHKMSFLRLMMHKAFRKNALGCHAASKIFRLRDEDGLKEYGAIIFGLSKTGKTTLTTSPHGLQFPERIFIPQDDIVVFTPDGKAIGTEQCFYVTTEGLTEKSHPTIWRAAASPDALLENVFLDEWGIPDFENISITANGRAVIQRNDLEYASDAPLDVEKIHYVFFITRRNDIIHPMVRLSPEWAALTFLLGESVQTAAGDPTKAGQAIRVPGFDPFMMVDAASVTNRFYELLCANPHIQCILLNTGSVGEKRKIRPDESARMIEAAVRGQVVWHYDPSEDLTGYNPAFEVPGVSIAELEPDDYYSPQDLHDKKQTLRRERLEYLEQYRTRLHPEIARLLQ